MTGPARRRVLLFLILVAGTSLSVYFWARRDREPEPDKRTEFFRDSAAEAGLVFRMSFLPDEQGLRFKINLYDHGAGVAVADFDNDGRDDIYFCNQLGPNALYRNAGDGTFEDVTARAGVALGDRVCVAATLADYDNDGHADLFVTSTRGGNVLFRNRGDSTFVDVTERVGLKHVGHCQAGLFFDADNDGHLDLLVLQTARWTTNEFNTPGRNYVGKPDFFQTAASEPEFNRFYRNNGNGTFTEVGEQAGLRGLGWAADAAVLDFNDDGRLDLLVTNMFGRAQLYRNRGDGSFEDVTLQVLGKTSWGGMGVRAFDLDNDGRLDLYLTDMHSDMWANDRTRAEDVDERRKYPHLLGPRFAEPGGPRQEQQLAELLKARYDEVLFGNTCFHNLGGGKFHEVSENANLETFWPWGLAVGDFDNDGFEDVFSPAGMGFPFTYWPNYLLMNNGNGTFTDRAAEYGVEPPRAGKAYTDAHLGDKRAARSSRAAAVADFAGDGRLDVVTNNFNDAPYLFRNHFPRRNYIAFKLAGTKSNRDAIGATVRLVLADGVMIRQVAPAGGYLAQSSSVLHFGLGQRAEVLKAEIRWPSGRQQVLDRPAINQKHRIVEPSD